MNEKQNKIDFLAIGDMVVDTIIKLKDAHVYCKVDKENCELCLNFGEKIPYESFHTLYAVGNSPNAVLGASYFGLSTLLISNIGDDKNGKECLDYLKNKNINPEYVSIHEGKETSTHFILSFQDERTILVKHKDYDYKFPDISNLDISFIYLSSVGSETLSYYEEVISYLKNNNNTKLIFSPGTFQLKLGKEKLKEIYENTFALFCNKEEAQKIIGQNESNVLNLAEEIEKLGPKLVFITDGKEGAYMYHEKELFYLPQYKNEKEIVEITGAGDAFASAISCGLASSLEPKDAFLLGPINSMSVIREMGPQGGLLSYEQIKEYLKNPPEDYKLEKLN